MNVIELKAVMLLPDGHELVHTGYYVPDTATLADVKKMFAKGLRTEFGELDVYKIEFNMEEEE